MDEGWVSCCSGISLTNSGVGVRVKVTGSETVEGCTIACCLGLGDPCLCLEKAVGRLIAWGEDTTDDTLEEGWVSCCSGMSSTISGIGVGVNGTEAEAG